MTSVFFACLAPAAPPCDATPVAAAKISRRSSWSEYSNPALSTMWSTSARPHNLNSNADFAQL